MYTSIIFILVLSLVTWTEQHLSYPVNYCYMAMTCIHDNRPVCASTPDGCSRRTFLDQCDMYEFNCDYNTRYHETYSPHCLEFGLEASVPNSPVTTPTTPTPITEISSTQKDKKNIEENFIADSLPCPPSKPPCTAATITPETATSKPAGTTTTPSQTESPTPSQAETNSSTEATTVSINCERPTTWETTTDNINTYSIVTIENYETEATSQKPSAHMEITKKDSPETTQKKETTSTEKFTSVEKTTSVEKNTLVKDITPAIETTPVEESSPVDVTTLVEENSPVDVTTLVEENIPVEITTLVIESTPVEKVTPVEETTPIKEIKSLKETTQLNLNEIVNNNVVSAVEELVDSSNRGYISNEDSEDNLSLYDLGKIRLKKNQTRGTKTHTSPTIPTTTTTTTPTIPRFPSKIRTIPTIPKTSDGSTTWWYPTMCKSENCERPVTWQTTRRYNWLRNNF